MSKSHPTPTGVEVTFDKDELLVSKTDQRGVIVYANTNFIDISGYTEAELIGRPHAIVRHPEMPGCIFQLLWNTVQSGSELFAFVVNLSKDGRHYWVFAHITPDFDAHTGAITGYHSSRRRASSNAIAQIERLYAQLRQAEYNSPSKISGIRESTALLDQTLAANGQTYEEFVCHLFNNTTGALSAA